MAAIKKKLQDPGISAAVLRTVALCAMLLDHLWASIVPGNMWMTYVGRIAFPIFAFQAAEGSRRTADFAAYSKRLLIFALISEIPFDLFMSGSPVFLFQQNVLFTLWVGLLAARQLQQAAQAVSVGQCLKKTAAFVGLMLASVLLLADYGWRGAALVVLFCVVRQMRFEQLWQLAGMALLFVFTFQGRGTVFTLFGAEIFLPTQAFSLLALPFIWCYNGEKGAMPRALRTVSYLFYPAHLLLLWAVMRFVL